MHVILYGTSAAAAHTTGALALLLQQTPTLTPSAARTLLADRARSDSFTGAVPNTLAGYGKLNVIARSTAVGAALAQRFSFAPPFPSPSAAQATFVFSLNSADLAGSDSRVELRIVDIQGRIVSILSGASAPGPQRLVWNGRGSDGVRARPGVYFAQLHVGAQQSVRRFLRLAS